MILACVFIVGAAIGQPPFEAKVAGGTPIVGTLVEVGPQGVVVETSSGRQTLADGQCDGLKPSTPPADVAGAPAVWVELVDGSQLVALSCQIVDRSTRLKSLHGAELVLPIAALRGIRLRAPSPATDAQWLAIVERRRETDVIITRKDDALDALEGVIGNVDENVVQFTLDGDTIPVKRGKVEGLLFAPPANAPTGAAACTVVDAAGSAWQVARASVVDGRWRMVTVAGPEVDVALDQIREIRFRSQFLSDLAPESFAWAPYVGIYAAQTASSKAYHEARTDRSPSSGEYTLGGQRRAKALALVYDSEVVYRLPEAFRRLTAVAGIDDRAGQTGNVRLAVYGDERLLTEVVLMRTTPPVALDVDVAGVRRLKIVVQRNGIEENDRFLLCEARLSK